MLYNLDYDQQRRQFQELIVLHIQNILWLPLRGFYSWLPVIPTFDNRLFCLGCNGVHSTEWWLTPPPYPSVRQNIKYIKVVIIYYPTKHCHIYFPTTYPPPYSRGQILVHTNNLWITHREGGINKSVIRVPSGMGVCPYMGGPIPPLPPGIPRYIVSECQFRGNNSRYCAK